MTHATQDPETVTVNLTDQETVNCRAANEQGVSLDVGDAGFLAHRADVSDHENVPTFAGQAGRVFTVNAGENGVDYVDPSAQTATRIPYQWAAPEASPTLSNGYCTTDVFPSPTKLHLSRFNRDSDQVEALLNRMRVGDHFILRNETPSGTIAGTITQINDAGQDITWDFTEIDASGTFNVDDNVTLELVINTPRDHNELGARDAADSHPASAITGVQEHIDNTANPHGTTFLSLPDTPPAYTQAYAVMRTSGGLNGIETEETIRAVGAGDMQIHSPSVVGNAQMSLRNSASAARIQLFYGESQGQAVLIANQDDLELKAPNGEIVTDKNATQPLGIVPKQQLDAHTSDGNIHFADAPADGVEYVRQNNAWVPMVAPAGILYGDIDAFTLDGTLSVFENFTGSYQPGSGDVTVNAATGVITINRIGIWRISCHIFGTQGNNAKEEMIWLGLRIQPPTSADLDLAVFEVATDKTTDRSLTFSLLRAIPQSLSLQAYLYASAGLGTFTTEEISFDAQFVSEL